MTPGLLEERLSDLIASQCVLLVLRGVGTHDSEDMLWQSFLAALTEQYNFSAAWYGRCIEDSVQPAVLFPPADPRFENFSGSIDLSSPAIRDAALVLPVSVENEVEGFLVVYSSEPVPESRAGQIAILLSEAAAALSLRRFRVRNEAALKQAKSQAESASRAKSLLLANVSHEIRTPLTGVLGYADLLERTPLSLDQREYVETIRSCGRNLLSLINDILDYSKIEAGKLGLENTPVDIRKLVEKTVGLLAVQAAEKGLRLCFRIDPSAPRTIMGDPLRLRQILLNLLGNAVKFTIAGEVALNVAGQQQEDGAATVNFAVRDTGPGIPAEQLDRIFDSFTQLDASISRKFGGTGLGLAISRALAGEMGGSLTVQSQPGEGATFLFTLPVRAVVGPVEVAAPAEPDFDGLPDARVIVADDNAVNRQVVLAFLKRLGYKADAAVNGADLLARVQQADYDVVFMDVQMPEMDGLEATHHIRRTQPLDRQPRIVAMTASALPEDRARCLEAGMDDFVSKPLELAELAAALRRARAGERLTPHAAA